MRLVDILARHLKAWPESESFAWQDFNREIRFSVTTRHDFYVAEVSEDHVREPSQKNPKSGVTRAEWQAAVDALNAPNVVELKIDWSKQPESFPLWLEGTNKDHRKHSGWYRENGEVFTCEDGGLWRSCREGQFFTVHRKPETPIHEWDGASLPCAGDSLEYKTTDAGDYWCKAIVKFVGTHFLLVGYQHPDIGLSEAGINHAMLDCNFSGLLRKARTAEQVAAEEREKAIEEMVAVSPLLDKGWSRKVCAALYDNDYRKQVSK